MREILLQIYAGPVLTLAGTVTLLATSVAAVEGINTVAGTPMYTGRLAFPTAAFKGMYYQPKHQEQEPRPKMEKQEGGFYPDSLNNPWHLPEKIPENEVVMPNNPGGDKEQAKMIIDHLFNIGYQLANLNKKSSATCNLCRTAVSSFAELVRSMQTWCPTCWCACASHLAWPRSFDLNTSVNAHVAATITAARQHKCSSTATLPGPTRTASTCVPRCRPSCATTPMRGSTSRS